MATLESLPNEIITLFFENLQHLAHLRASQRLISRRFNSIVIPLLYQHHINALLLLNRWPEVYPQPNLDFRLPLIQTVLDVYRHFCLYGHHVTITRPAYIPSLVRLLCSTSNLEMLTCSYWDIQKYEGNRPTYHDWSRGWESYLPTIIKAFPDLELSIENLNIGNEAEVGAASIYPARLRSCKVRAGPHTIGPPNIVLPFVPHGNQEYRISNQFQDMLVKCVNLEVLHIIKEERDEAFDCAGFPAFSNRAFKQSKRLPPVTELLLWGYNWCHPSTVANSFWDWSRLTRLELQKVSIVKFLRTVHLQQLSQLKIFLTDSFCELQDPRNELDPLLCNAISTIGSLQRLAFKTFMYGQARRVVATHSNLEYLDMRDICVPRRQPPGHSGLEIGSLGLLTLAELKTKCFKLMELKLNLASGFLHISGDTSSKAVIEKADAFQQWISTLSSFRNLRRLTLYTYFEPPKLPSVMDPNPTLPENIYDPDIDRLVDRLRMAKQGSPFELIEVRSMLASNSDLARILRKKGRHFPSHMTYRYVGDLDGHKAAVQKTEHGEDAWEDA